METLLWHGVSLPSRLHPRDTNRYSIPTEYAYRSCQIKVFVDKVDIYFAHELIASHKKCYLKEQYILDPLHYIKLLERKPGSLGAGILP